MRFWSNRLWFSVGIFLFGMWTYSQKIIVKDQQTGQPLETAVILDSENNAAITDIEGQALLSDFDSDQSLTVSLLGYEDYSFVLDKSQQLIEIFLEPENLDLDEVVLSVARSTASRSQIAEKVSVISKREIEFNQPSTGADLLKLSPGVRLQKSQGGGGSPILRGLEANRILMVIDGVRMNNAIYRSGHHQYSLSVDPNTIERVEVTFGSSSVGYGSDGLGGVIHYYTKTPRLNPNGYSNISLNSSISSTDNQLINNISVELGFKKWGSFTSFTYSDFGDIRMGKVRKHGYDDWGLVRYYSRNTRENYSPYPTRNIDPLVQKNSGYQQADFFQKFIYQIDSKDQLLLNLQFSTTSDVPRFDRLLENTEGKLRFAEWFYGPQKRFLISGQYKFFSEHKFLNKGLITFAYQNINESRINRGFNSLTRSHQNEAVDVFSLNADFDFKLNDIHKISYGVEATHNLVDSNAYSQEIVYSKETEILPPEVGFSILPNSTQSIPIIDFVNTMPIPSRYPSDRSYVTTLAAYGNWVWDFNPKLSLNLGLRMNYVEVFAQWNEVANIDALLNNSHVINRVTSETVSLIYRPKNLTQWNFIVSSGFRSPNIDDLGKIRESGGVLLVPNDFLKAEYAYSLDIGYNRRFNRSSNYISLRAYGTLLSRHIGRDDYQIISDISTPDNATIIYSDHVVETEANKNLGRRYIYGATYDSRISLIKNLDLISSLTITEGVKHKDYGPLPSILPLFGGAELRYNNKRFQMLLEMEFNDSKYPEDYSVGGEDGLEETPLVALDSGGNTEYAGTPSSAVYHFKSEIYLLKNATIRLSVENILDIHYKPFASGISSPGRNFRIGVQYRF
ncbi:MAG: TonB-dependent receptor [Flavobacteriaceae bacterium]|nr:TonB-dependent receptor [Flavobacteriaceae bacterium]